MPMLFKYRSLDTWLSVDKLDSEPERFLRYVIAAVCTIFPQFGSDVVVSSMPVLEELLLLVLDDYHTLSSEPVQEILIRMCSACPTASIWSS